jgi:hypothetical protein
VAEQFLHRTNVIPGFEQVRVETVPQVCGELPESMLLVDISDEGDLTLAATG